MSTRWYQPYDGPMEIWTRPDGRFYAIDLWRDLYGPAVVIHYGGDFVSRTRIVPVADTVEGEKMLAHLADRRAKHGYRLTPGA